MSDYIFIYTTHPDTETAKKISKQLVEEKLIACANILPSMQSIYLWEGKVNEDSEVVAIFKTKKVLFEKVKDHVTKCHPYDVPCVVALKLEQGHVDFLNWIKNSTL